MSIIPTAKEKSMSSGYMTLLESHRKLSAESKAFKELAAFIIRAHQTVFINADISKESKKEILHHFNISSNILD